MAELIHTTSLRSSGPWLLDYDKLEAFDKIVSREFDRLKGRRLELVDAKVNSIIQSRLSRLSADVDEKLAKEIREYAEETAGWDFRLKREKCELTIMFKSGKKLVAASFEDTHKNPSIQDEIAGEFEFRLECGEVDCDLDVSRHGGELRLKVSPESSSEAWELFVALRRWVYSVQSPWWQRAWRAFNGVQWAAWCGVLCLWASIATTPNQIDLRNEARHLVSQGLRQEDTTKAVELLLAFQSGYVPPGAQTANSAWVLWTFTAFSAICLVLSFPPSTVLGIGRGEQRIQTWRRWITLVSVTVPSLIGAVLIKPLISRLLIAR